MKKKIPRKGYRVLAIVWTLASASVAVAVVRRLPELSVATLCLLAASVTAAAGFWNTYRRTPEETFPNHFDTTPKFADNPVLFDDDPIQDSEEKKT